MNTVLANQDVNLPRWRVRLKIVKKSDDGKKPKRGMYQWGVNAPTKKAAMEIVRADESFPILDKTYEQRLMATEDKNFAEMYRRIQEQQEPVGLLPETKTLVGGMLKLGLQTGALRGEHGVNIDEQVENALVQIEVLMSKG